MPKGFLDTIQSIPFAHIPLQPHGGPFPPQDHVSAPSCLTQKDPQTTWNTNPDPGVPKGLPGLKISNLHIESHAESSGRYSKPSHMLQVMVENPFGLGGASERNLWMKSLDEVSGLQNDTPTMTTTGNRLKGSELQLATLHMRIIKTCFPKHKIQPMFPTRPTGTPH